MIARFLAGAAAALLLIAFIAPVVVKLKDYALTGVVLAGLATMLVDLWQSLRERDRG